MNPRPTGNVATLDITSMCLGAFTDGTPMLCTLAGAGPFLAVFDTLEDCVAFHAKGGRVVERPMRVDDALELLISLPRDVRVIARPREIEPNKWRWFEIQIPEIPL